MYIQQDSMHHSYIINNDETTKDRDMNEEDIEDEDIVAYKHYTIMYRLTMLGILICLAIMLLLPIWWVFSIVCPLYFWLMFMAAKFERARMGYPHNYFRKS